ncbi:MAG: hypothetical protein ACLUPL_10660 [Butyricimonas virosa]
MIVTILTMFTILTFTKLPADVVFMGGMAVLFVSGVLFTPRSTGRIQCGVGGHDRGVVCCCGGTDVHGGVTVGGPLCAGHASVICRRRGAARFLWRD